MRRTDIIFAIGFGLIIAIAAGCSSGSTIKPFDAAKNFPTEQRIAEIQATPAGEPKFRDTTNEGRVDYWELAGPLPNTWGSQTIRSNSPVAQAIDKEFTNARMTESMACYAREVGLFYVHYEKFPYVELDDFMKRRCGLMNDIAAVRSWGFQRPDVDEAEFLKAGNWGDFLDSVTDEDEDSDEYGVWVGSGRKGTYVMVTRASVPAKIKPLALNQSAGAEVVIEGELTEDADYVFGLMTQGEYDYGECTTTQGLESPAFQVTCDLKGNDPTILVTVSRGNESDVFSTGILEAEFIRPSANRMLFVANGATVPEPVPAPGAQAGTSADGSTTGSAAMVIPRPNLLKKPVESRNMEPVALRKRLVEGINRVRQEAGRPAVTLEEAQSEANMALVPYAFANEDLDAQNEALLGAMAGWKVTSPVVDGSFRSRYLSGGDADDFIVSILESPSGRRLLLAEDVDAVAIGSKFDETSQSAAVLLTSYQFLEKRPHVKRVNEFLDKLARARKARGASPPRKVKGLKRVADSLAARVEKGELPFNEATAKLWDAALQEFQSTTYIYYAAAHDPLKLKFQERLLTMEPLRIGIMVTPFKPKNSPWIIYGIAIAYPKTNSVTKVAQVEPVEDSSVKLDESASR